MGSVIHSDTSIALFGGPFFLHATRRPAHRTLMWAVRRQRSGGIDLICRRFWGGSWIYCTVRLTTVDWVMEPDVALMVTGVAPGGVEGGMTLL